jgi:hypothetical protein
MSDSAFSIHRLNSRGSDRFLMVNPFYIDR